MNIPLDTMLNTAKLGAAVQTGVDTPVRVAVFVDASATPFLIKTIREAFVPQTTSALIRVERLGTQSVTVKPDTDISIVLSCGSECLQDRVQEIVIAGAPTVVLAESAVEVPFIEHDTPMLGLIAATDAVFLLDELARWILDCTEKDTAFAANFSFMRIAAARRIITTAALGNAATGALFFMPGADFPVMTAAQVGMMFKLAAVFGKPLHFERAYEALAIVASAFVMRSGTRALAKELGHAAFVLKALVGGAGTLAMGYALVSLYQSDVDYSRANALVLGALDKIKDLISTSTVEA